MSNFPPPNVGPTGPTGPTGPVGPTGPSGPVGGVAGPAPWSPVPPPPPGAVVVPPASPAGYGYQPNAPSAGGGRKRGGLIIVGLVVVAALAAGGIYLATRDDNDGTASDSTTEVTEQTEATEPAETTVPDTEPTTETTEPATTEPETTAAETTEVATTEAPTTDAPTTSEEPTTTAFEVPAGAIPLGHDVYLPIPSGWSQINDPEEPTLITDGTTKFGVQVLARDVGEDIVALVQEYVNTFDTAYAATSFGPTHLVGPVQGSAETNEYVTFYTTYDPGDAVGLTGTIDTLVRADGLSVIIDVFSPSSSAFTLPQDAYDSMVASLGAAPLLGPTAPPAAHDPFRVTSVTPVVIVDGLVGFSMAPGFAVVTQGAPGSPYAQVTTGAEDFSVLKVSAQADVNAVIATAQGNLVVNYTNVAYQAPTADAADSFGVLHGAFTWTGTYLGDQQASAGSINYYFDLATGNAYVVYRTWFTTNGPAEPSIPEGEFMLRSLYNSITTIP